MNKVKEFAQKNLDYYLSGNVPLKTGMLFCSRWAAYDEFFEFLEIFPSEFIEGFKQRGREAWGHPEDYDGYSTTGGTYSNTLLWYWSGVKLRKHYFPNLEPPKFEPLVNIGKIEEVMGFDKSPFLLGEFDVGRLGAYPLVFSPKLNLKGDAKIKCRDAFYLKLRSDEDSTNRRQQELGRRGMLLDCQGVNLSEIPIGTDVFANRESLKGEIPPPPPIDKLTPSS